MTLSQHAEAWWIEQGNTVPDRDSAEYGRMYSEWVDYAFADLREEE